jgi:hypothetical protein
MKVKALEFFQDGNILGFTVDPEQVVEVTRREYELMVQSGGRFEVVPVETPVTLVVKPVQEDSVFPPLTEKQLEAKQLKEKQELEAKQLKEKQQRDADQKASEDVEPNNHPTVTDEAQATRAAEELAQKRLAEKRAKEAQAEADKAAQEVSKDMPDEVKSEPVNKVREHKRPERPAVKKAE